MVTVVLAVNGPQFPLAGKTQLIVYVPTIDVEGVIAPVELLIVSPAGLDEYVPPVAPTLVIG